MTAAKKTTPAAPPLSLPERPPSKVEAGLAATEQAPQLDPAVQLIGDAAGLTADELREQAIAAMVAAGLSQEFAEAAFVLKEEGASAADVAEAVAEISTEPLCEHGCHGQSWADVRADLDAVSCEHGSYKR